MDGWTGTYDRPPPVKETTDTSRRTRSRSRSFSTETRTTHKVEVLDLSGLLRSEHIVFVVGREKHVSSTNSKLRLLYIRDRLAT